MSTIKAINFQHPDAASPAVQLAASGTASLSVSAINDGPLAGFKNAIINGNFDIWQRGLLGGPAGYWADRWNAYPTQGTGMSQAQTALTNNERDLIGYESRYALTVNTDTQTAVNIQQSIEGVHTFSGQTVTISFWAWLTTGTQSITAKLTQLFGTGGSPSAAVDTPLTLSTSTLTTTPVKITATVQLPSVAGKTLGSNNNDYLALIISKPAPASMNNIKIAQVQFEVGPTATPFERRPIATELMLCQRYYWRGLPLSAFNYCPYVGSAVGSIQVPFPVPMRAVPNLGSNLNGATFGGGATLGAFSGESVHGARQVLVSTTAATNAFISFASNNYFEASAEL